MRAVMDGIAFSIRDSVELMSELGVVTVEFRITGGGAPRQPLH